MHQPQIVGVGASAGGLEALQALVAALPSEPNLLFLVVMHLDPTQPSSIVELLGRAGPLRVESVVDGQVPELNRMYVAPPAMQLELVQGRLKLSANGKTRTHPIDTLFKSLADDAGERAVAIVLSGSGSDGSVGLAAVRAAGGLTFAQDQSAGFSSMPRSAIDRGVVDHVLSPKQIAEELLKLTGPLGQGESAAVEGDAAMSDVFATIQARRGIDFSSYKPSTIRRRVHRRLVARHLDSLADYVRLLAAEASEVDALVDDILINVTEFFRDPETFTVLAAKVLPRFDARDASQTLRVWVVGCSTGQEAYSIAIAILEHQAESGLHRPIKIFATDIDEDALDRARMGCYSSEECSGLSVERRRQFFVAIPGGLQVNKQVRELCVFARHDATCDPPFSRIDLISCRNVMIYFDRDLQRRVIPLFHYSLDPGGVLMLGKAESVGEFETHFEPLDGDHRVYLRRGGMRERIPELPASSRFASVLGEDPRSSAVNSETSARQADRFLVGHYAPPAVLVDDALRVVEFRGDTSEFLSHASGIASLSILKLARPDLLAQLSQVLETAKQAGESWREGVHLRHHDRDLVLDLGAVRLAAGGYLVLFEDPAQSATRTPTPMLSAVARAAARRVLFALERRTKSPGSESHEQVELALTRRRLQELIGEHEAKTEELKAANEEVLSSNEELQSTNEELQTTKEEVQATNEELLTVNEELQARNLVLTRINDDLNNLLSSINIPIVMIGRDRRIRRFTPNAAWVFNLIEGDIGRPLAHIKPDLESGVLDEMIDSVLEHLQIEVRELQDHEGRWHRITVRPYRTSDDKIDGAVISIIDIDDLKQAETRLRAARDYAESIVETVHEPLVVVDAEFRVVSVNRAFATTFMIDGVEARGRSMAELGIDWNAESALALLERAIDIGKDGASIELRLWPKSPRERVLSATARPIRNQDGEPLFLLALSDVTGLHQREQHEIQLINSVLETQARERERLAHELHDETGQALSALLVGLGTLARDIEGERATALLDKLRGDTRELIDSIGRLARGLHPAALEQLGLCGGLHQLVDHFVDSNAIEVDLRIERDADFDRLGKDTGLGLFRIIQEALTNVARHANASKVDIELAIEPRPERRVVRLRVSDDGEGFDVRANSNGLGLRLIERRVVEFGGVLRVESTPGSGTSLWVEIPIPEPSEGP